MMFKQAKAVRKSAKPHSSAKLHSIAAMLAGRSFEGAFEVGQSSYGFTYTPQKAEIAGQKLQLTGSLTVAAKRPSARGSALSLINVRAWLATAQGGIGTAPTRPQGLHGGVQPAAPAVPAPQPPQTANAQTTSAGGRPIPIVESTGPLSFCGVMYFRFEPINARLLGVAADMSKVQLNARLAPVDNAGRALHAIYSAIVEALYGKQTDERLAEAAIVELNKMLNAN
jgi:hypothetical protein